MKSLVAAAALLFTAQYTIAQKMVVDVNPSSAQIYMESAPVKNGGKVKISNVVDILLATKEGYCTVGYSSRELQKMGKESLTLELEEIKKLPSGFESKSIDFNKFSDASGKVERPAGVGLYGVPIAALDLNTDQFRDAVDNAITDFGYNAVNTSQSFEEVEADIMINANITHYNKQTAGSGFQVSLLIEWTVKDMKNQKTFKLKTAAFSDEGQPKFHNELPFSLENGIQGLLNNSEFQAMCKK